MITAIQAVPERARLVESLLGKLPGAQSYFDADHRGPLWNMENIFRDNPGEDILVIQDDVAVPPWFREEFDKAVIRDRAMSFFMGITKHLRIQYDRGMSYAETRNVWGQANYYPAKFVSGYLEWSESHGVGGPGHSHDDLAIRRYLKAAGGTSLVTLPNLVNHIQQEPSTMGNPLRPGGRLRTSPLFGRQYLRPWDKSAIGRLPK